MNEPLAYGEPGPGVSPAAPGPSSLPSNAQARR
jgi:hypothetical protein